MRLQGRTAIITGGGSGIGQASAALFAKEGAFVALVDRDEAGLKETLAALPNANSASMHVGDVSDGDFAQSVVGEIVARRGQLDVLMTSAGFSCGGTVVTTAPADWDAVFRTNVGGTWLWARAAIPQMQKQGKGSIIAARHRRRQGQQRLYRRQGRDHQPDPHHGCRFRHRWHSRQRHRAWRYRHTAAEAQLRTACGCRARA
jgi:NAD(P)-dependent dehydrogenase (short-subunit alcohol dehydrogenase family)